MAANKTIGGINVTITASTEKFVKGMAAARRNIASFQQATKGLVFNLKTLGAALAVGGVSKAIADQFKAVDALEELSQKTGVQTDKLAGLQLAARNAGVDNALLEKSLVKLNSAFGMQGDKALEKWITDTSKLTTQQERLAAATEMFGSKGSSMVRFLNGGVGALREAQKAANDTGLAITQIEATAVANLMQSFDNLRDRTIGVFRQMAVASAPFVDAMVQSVNGMIDGAGGGKGVGKFIADVLVHMAKSVVDLIQEMTNLAAIAFHGLQTMVVEFRSSIAGKAMGVGYSSAGAELMARGGLAKNYDKVETYINRPKWSAGIDKMVADATAAAAKAVADSALKGPGLLDGLGEAMKKYAMGSAQSWKGAGMNLWGAASGRFMEMAQAAGAYKPPSMAQRPALAFAESGSVESYRQQAAIRKQGEDISKKSLRVQERMEGHLADMKGMLNFPAANLG